MTCPSRLEVTLKSLASIAIGGGAGAMVKILEAVGDPEKINMRSLVAHTVVGAVLAIAAHWAPPPNSPKS